MKNVAKYATGLNLIYVVLICRDRLMICQIVNLITIVYNNCKWLILL